jgi:hypothetical protein
MLWNLPRKFQHFVVCIPFLEPLSSIPDNSLEHKPARQTAARHSLFWTRRAAIRSTPPASTVTPEKIEIERYPYFSASAPLIGTLAIALK